MIGSQSKSLPTKFAVKLAEYAGLYVPADEERGNEELWYDLRDRLSNFQKMALACDFETSMIAYFDMEDELSEAQLAVLRRIHENTKKWMFGHVAEIMLDNLERSSRTNNKDKKEIAQMFIENFVKPEEASNPEKKKGLLVRFANLPPGTEIAFDESDNESEGEEIED